MKLFAALAIGYAWLTIKHKWFVLVAGLKLGCPVYRLLTHDLSKFSPCELPHYQRQFFGLADDPEGFTRCWLHHQNSNDHHWEYWIPRTGHNRGGFQDGAPLRMTEGAMLEMLADWFGASRAYEGKWPKPGEWQWVIGVFGRIQLHDETRCFLRQRLLEQGFIV